MLQTPLPGSWLERMAQGKPSADNAGHGCDLYARLRQALQVLAEMECERILITVDGPCGSGKSTLAAELAHVIGADVVHMDDFVIPHAQKTAHRLSQPGGNADIERLMAEVVSPWLAHGCATYQPYRCHEDAYGELVTVCSRYLIVEGSYSNLPQLRQVAALRLFVSVPPREQRDRLLRRVGPERIGMFEQRWIPLENAYLEHYDLPDADCLLVSAHYDQAE